MGFVGVRPRLWCGGRVVVGSGRCGGRRCWLGGRRRGWSVSVGFAAGGWDGADAAQGGEFGVGGDAVGVVAGGDELTALIGPIP